MAGFTLEVIAGQHVGARFALNGDIVSIGREATNIIRLEDNGVSRRHARLMPSDGLWVVEDLNSKNGVLVAGKKVTSQALKAGDEIIIGDARLRFMTEIINAAETNSTVPAVKSPNPPLDGSTLLLPNKEKAPSIALPDDDTEAVAYVRAAREKILAEMSKVVIGQKEVIDQILVAMFSRGHCLMVGVPGLAKTLMVRTLGQATDMDNKRIQFTPDLMPSDITGTQILEEDQQTHQRNFRFMRGPIFTHILLADEINRTPPKTQAALLEAMQESRVTAGGTTYQLAQPFFVLATQNPIEQEGTYPLPEAQLDRFMFMIKLNYPSRDEEMEIYRATTGDSDYSVRPILSGEAILKLQKIVRSVPVSDHVTAYAADLVRATRPDDPNALKFIKDWLSWGAGPRAGQYLLLAAKARAVLLGRMNVSCDDVRSAAHPVLRHRIFCNFNATSEGIDSDKVIDRLLKEVPEQTEKNYK
jgi:MoxR-like ATPase